MLRVLLIILSVVSAILAYALGQPLLYVVALALLAGSATLTTVNMKKRHADVPESFMKAPDEPEEDLEALGIVEIRPKVGRSAPVGKQPEPKAQPVASSRGQQVLDFQPEDSEQASVPVRRRPAPASSARREEHVPEIIGEVRTRKPRARIMVSEAAPEQDADVLIPALRSLRAGLDAYTVCVLRQEASSLRYHVEAIVSQNSYARSQGSFTAVEPLVAGERALVPLVYPHVGGDGLAPSRLGYYHEPIAVRQVAMVVISQTHTGDSHILVVDTMTDGGLESESARAMLEQYARLIYTFFEAEERGDLVPAPPAISERGVKPRREIIADEMQKARQESKPLALALVFLNRGEEMEGDGERDVSQMESALEARLREVASTGRVERFGELMFGVFYRGDAATVASWASHLQTSFVDTDGHLQGGVSVGVALLNARHESPEDLRADATAALHTAFETGECTIVE